MSILIDKLITEYGGDPKRYDVHCGPFCDKGKEFWYIAKDIPFYGISPYIMRIKDAWRVLTDKSRAYHYKEDEENS